jgi:hypothetical protein
MSSATSSFHQNYSPNISFALQSFLKKIKVPNCMIKTPILAGFELAVDDIFEV